MATQGGLIGGLTAAIRSRESNLPAARVCKTLKELPPTRTTLPPLLPEAEGGESPTPPDGFDEKHLGDVAEVQCLAAALAPAGHIIGYNKVDPRPPWNHILWHGFHGLQVETDASTAKVETDA